MSTCLCSTRFSIGTFILLIYINNSSKGISSTVKLFADDTSIFLLQMILLLQKRDGTVIYRKFLCWHINKKYQSISYFIEGYKVPPEKKQSHLQSQFPPEMTLFKFQQNFQSCLKLNFLFTPIFYICFKKFSR